MMSASASLDLSAGEVGDAVVETPVGANRVLERDPVLLAEAEVVLSERDRCVDQARSLVGRDEVTEQHRVPAWPVVGDEAERRVVRGAGDRVAGEVRDDLGCLAEDRLDALAGHHQHLIGGGVRFDPHVFDVGAGGDRRVRDQRPRSRRPDDELVADLKRGLRDRVGRRDGGDGQLHVGRQVGDVVVAERDLVGRERRLAARAVGDDLVALVEAAGVPHLAHRPPARLDVVVVHRHVGVLEVDPEADALGQPVPVLDVAEDGGATSLVELGDPVLLDLGLGADP